MAIAFDRQLKIPGQVYDVLHEKILSVELKPGESINERRLADWLGVSRTPIREAIRRLADNGLISIVSNVGTSVALINAKRVEELQLIRTSLETLSARQAAERFDKSAEINLGKLIEDQSATLEPRNFKQNIAIDNEFHRTITEVGGLPLTWAILQQVMGELTRLRYLSMRLADRLPLTINEHSAILSALRDRDPDASEIAMKIHLARSHKSILEILGQYPAYVEQ